MFCDNMFAIFLVKCEPNTSKVKHININYHDIQNIVESGEIIVDYVPSSKMVAEPLTKGLYLKNFRLHVPTMNLRIIQMDSCKMRSVDIIY